MWQPIETVPKDGTAVLLIGVHEDGVGGQYTHGGEPYVARWVPSAKWPQHSWVVSGGTRYASSGFGEPTHWMPLPEPPTA